MNNDRYGSIVWPDGAGDDLPDRIWTQGDFAPVEEFPVAELTRGYTSGSFIKAALRRRVRFWCAFTFIGLLIGLAMYVAFPPAYEATATILLTNNPNDNPTMAMKTEESIAQSLPVAERAVRQLGQHQSVASFRAASTVTVLTDQVLTITVGAPSADAAVADTNALAAAYLQYRAGYLQTQQQSLVQDLNQQQSQAQQHLNSLKSQVATVSAEPSSQAQQKDLKKLQAEEADAVNALGQVKAYVIGAAASSKTTMDTMVHNSRVLGAATLAKHSSLKSMVLYAAGGLIGGLAVGLGIVVVGALVSDRLRRRDDIADAIGAPVGLSVGMLRKPRIMTMPQRAAQRNLDMRRVVAYLRNSLPGSSRGPASLAVVAVDDTRVTAQAVASLAVSYAQEGKRVIAADLSGAADLAHLLGVDDPGMHSVALEGANFFIAVPKPDDVAPVGPVQGNTLLAVPGEVDAGLLGKANSADVLLTLASLDPAFGSEYLATWATDAVAMVTSGQSSWERINSVSAMIRLAEMRLDSVVLVEADKSDQSIGVNSTLG